MKALVIIGLDTGMRLSELLRLSDDNIEDGYIRVYINKADNPRSIPMTSRVRGQIDIIKPLGFFEDLTKNKACYYFNEVAVKKLNLQDVSFHTLRHTFCSRLVQRGVSIDKVSKLAGHKTIQVTIDRYAHLRNKDLEEAIAVLEQ